MILSKDEIMAVLWKDGNKVLSGWWKDCLFDVYSIVSEYQKNNGVNGNLAEIGIYKGRSLIPLVNFKEQHETVIAVDIDDVTQVDKYIKKVFSGVENVNLIRANSIKENVFADKGPFRMFYIDGDHSYDGCLSDLRCASNVVDNGIIFLDDYNNDKYGRDVRNAIDKFIIENKGWSLVAITGQTLWISKNEYVNTYIDVFKTLNWNIVTDPFYTDLNSFQDPKGLYHH